MLNHESWGKANFKQILDIKIEKEDPLTDWAEKCLTIQDRLVLNFIAKKLFYWISTEATMSVEK